MWDPLYLQQEDHSCKMLLSDYMQQEKYSCKILYYLQQEKHYCYMTPRKDLLWLAETSLHWLWQIMMSNRDELKTG